MLQFIIGILLEEGIGIRNTVKCNKEINLRPIVLTPNVFREDNLSTRNWFLRDTLLISHLFE